MEKLELYTFGKPFIRFGGQPLSHLVSAKAQGLLIYLALTKQPHSRSALAGLLWGDMPEDTARANLRLTLNKLNNAVGSHLSVSRQSIAFDFQQPHWIDAAQFETLFASPQQPSEQAHRGLSLYRGNFLEDFYVPNAPEFESWVVSERGRLCHLAIEALNCLIEQAEERGDYNEGIALTRRLLSIEAWNEEAHRRLMWFLACSGQRSAALVQFETCRRVLETELGVDPSPDTSLLYEQIRTSEVGRETPAELNGGKQPPKRTLELPLQLTSFIGREAEQAQIAALLADPNCRLLTLVGPGGIGKTRLATSAAESLMTAFKDGAVFVSLVGMTPANQDDGTDLLIAAIANALHYTFTAQQSPRDLLLYHLADQHLLLVLDNFEQLRTASPFLLKMLQSAPKLKLLLTSRERLGVAVEWVFDVEGLPYVGDLGAVELFIQTARRIRPEVELTEQVSAIQEICRLVDGSPLGIELAASWARLLPCSEILDKLEHGLDILMTSSPLVADRHCSMRAVLDRSWALLRSEEQRTFQRLSAFQGSFDLTAAVQIAEATLPILAGLMDKSLLKRDGDDHYRIHDLLRQYGLEKLSEQPREAVLTQEKLSGYYGELVASRREALIDQPDNVAVQILDQNIENIRAAWKWLQAKGDSRQLDLLLEGLWPFYRHKGWFQEAVYVLEQASLLPLASVLQRVRWQRWLGEAHYQMGNLMESQACLERAFVLAGRPLPKTPRGWRLLFVRQLLRQVSFRLLPNKRQNGASAKEMLQLELAAIGYLLAHIAFLSDQQHRLVGIGLLTVNLAEPYGPSPQLALGYAGCCISASSASLYSVADYYLTLAQQSAQVVSSLSANGFVSQLAALHRLATGRWEEGTKAAEKAAVFFDQAKMYCHAAECRSILAKGHYFHGQFRWGIDLHEAIFQSAQRSGDNAGQHWSLMGRTECALRLGEPSLDVVLSWLRQAQSLLSRNIDPGEVIRLYGLLALVHLYNGNRHEAYQMALVGKQVIERTRFTGFWALEGHAGVAEVFLTLWEACLRGDETPADAPTLSHLARDACTSFRKFARIYPIAQPRIWLYLGWYAWLQGKPTQAHRHWDKSLESAGRLDMLYEQGRAYYQMGRHPIPRAEVGGSRNHLKQAHAIFSKLGAASDLAQTELILERGDFLT